MTRRSLVLLVLTLAAGCRTQVSAPEGEVDRRQIYQTIANALPHANLGWGDPPGIVRLAASVKAEGDLPEPRPLLANEEGFRIHYEVYRPRDVWIPYSALEEQTSYHWLPFPNVLLLPFLVVPLQGVRAEVVVHTGQVPGLWDTLMADVHRLEGISREVGMGGPWSHAQDVKAKLNADARDHGNGSLVLYFDFLETVPPWFPVGGDAAEVARAFAWAAAHPHEPTLPDEPPPPAGDEPPGDEQPGQ